MARTRDPEAHRTRREAYVEAATALIQHQGYEAFSLADVIDAVGSSKGALYHYFDSKAALLDATVESMVEAALADLAPAVDDPARTAVQRLSALFQGLAQWKSARKELVLALMTTWFSDDNAIVREHLRVATAARLRPMLAGIIKQGMDEGSMHVPDATGAAEVFVALLLGANESASRLFIARQAHEVSFAEVERTLGAYNEALGRVLGLAPGKLTLVGRNVLKEWYA
jgi:AcrR family transcriptional regulator